MASTRGGQVVVDQPAVGDPAAAVDPDVDRGGAVDDLLVGVVEVGQAGPVARSRTTSARLAGSANR